MDGTVGQRASFNDEAESEAALERQIGSGRRGLHAGDGLDALERLAAHGWRWRRCGRSCVPVSEVSMVRTLCGSKPGATLCSAEKVRMSRPAPTSSTMASAISTTTSRLRALFWRRPEPEREAASFRVELRSAREA